MSNIQIKNICLQVYTNQFKTTIFLAGFPGQGFLNKDPTVWLDGARPANTRSRAMYPATHAHDYIFANS